ncbi:MAG: prepilin-type N-terminal cleavage/methylation domain-containing protein [Desulfohalobiaceae bacterium]|nr:prepilin-type N-terminal cleavage/methylation domain-containing protein [Desulfohalobiaceae bacterium]
MNKLSNKKKSGFTLVELLVVTAISGIILAAIGKLFISSNEIYSSQEQRVRIQQDLRASTNFISKYIRMVGLDPSGNATCAGFSAANETAVHLSIDYNGDGNCTGNGPAEEVAFSFAGNELKLGYGGNTPSLFAPNISTFELRYFLANGSNSTSPGNLSDIRTVQMRVCGQIAGPYSGKYDNEQCLTKKIQCRNMGL